MRNNKLTNQRHPMMRAGSRVRLLHIPFATGRFARPRGSGRLPQHERPKIHDPAWGEWLQWPEHQLSSDGPVAKKMQREALDIVTGARPARSPATVLNLMSVAQDQNCHDCFA